MDNTENNKNTKLQDEKITKGTREDFTLSKLGIFSLILVGISLVLALIVLTIKVWKFFIAKVEQVGEGTFFWRPYCACRCTRDNSRYCCVGVVYST